MSVLVVAEHDNKNLKSSTLNTISAAEKLSEEIHLLILGNKINVIIYANSHLDKDRILKTKPFLKHFKTDKIVTKI